MIRPGTAIIIKADGSIRVGNNCKTKKRVTLVLIITSVVLFLTSGTAPGVLCILLTWAVNAILDYGVTLQVQSDETL